MKPAATPSSAGPAPSAPRVPARERLLAAARQLFYEEGINTVGIDRVIERAGVAKASLYDCFGSKEALVHAYLDERQAARKARLTEGLARFRTPRTRLLGVFDILGELFVETDFRGCAFLKADVEMRQGGSVHALCVSYRGWVVELFTRLAREAGARDPAALADQLMLLYDGATVSSQMERATRAAASARAMAAALLDAATAAR